MAACISCGTGLSVTQRVRGRKRCDDCQAKSEALRRSSIAEYASALQEVTSVGPSLDSLGRLRSLEASIVASDGDFQMLRDATYKAFLDQALADEILSGDEENRLNQIGEALYGKDEAAHVAVLGPYRSAFFIAMVNDGRLPVLPATRMVLKRNEKLHLEEPASLLKEVIQREFQSGSRGVSFRVMKGVSYRVGASRGRMVEVGRSLQSEDDGALCVTSLRAVYMGTRKTIEMPYTKVLDLNVYNDAVQIHMSGRQKPPTLGVANGPMVAAFINAAIQASME
jgi:hypothetical protein